MDIQKVLEQWFLTKVHAFDQALRAYPRLYFAIAHHRNIYGKEMTFHDKPYLTEIYKDTNKRITLKSSVQTGKSEFLIVSAHSWAEKGLQVLYVLPTIDIRNKFVANRVDKLYEKSPYYASTIRGSDSRGLKHFGEGTIYFEGSNSSTTFIEKPIDLVVGDETDRFDQSNYEKAEDRMTASPHKLWYEASNPTVDNYGIDYTYKKSDQREWFVKCGACNYWQTLDWFKNVVRPTDDNYYALLDEAWKEEDQRDPHVHCAKCAAPLNRYDIRGQWVAKHPKKQGHSGYHIHQLLSSFVETRKMWEKFQEALTNDTKLQVFYNSQLGLTYAGKGSKITDSILNACVEDYLMPAEADQCFMGVDVGKVLHVTIWQQVQGGRLRLVFAGTVREFEDLDYLFARYNIVSYCLDAMPETRKSLEYAKKHTGRGWVARYSHGLTEVRKDEEQRIITADRTMLMDQVMSWFVGRRFMLPKNAATLDKGDLYEMLKTPTRFFDAEKNVFTWQGDPDHYFHSAVYALLSYIGRGDFSVVGVSVGSLANGPSISTVKMPESFEKAVAPMYFPPGTDPQLIKHYEHLYQQMQKQHKINSNE